MFFPSEFCFEGFCKGREEVLKWAEWGNQDVKLYALYLAGVPLHEKIHMLPIKASQTGEHVASKQC